MDGCKTDLATGHTVRRHVKRYSTYKNCCILLVLLLIVQSCMLVYSIIQLCKEVDSDLESCSESSRAVWIPYKDNRSQLTTLADRSRFYCRTLDHKLSHLIDFLVVANRSTVYVPNNVQLRYRVYPATTRPSTQILHYHGVQGQSSSLKQQSRLRLDNTNEVKVLGNGSVEITQDGIYCVYSIVTFVHTPSDTKVPNDEYRIYRRRLNVRTVILSAETAGQKKYQQTESYKTLDLSGSFDLRQGDILSPVIRNISSVYAFTAANYWGVYQIKPKRHSVHFVK